MAKHILQFQKSENPKKRLFCFPYAGAGAAIYRQWLSLLPSEIELYAIDPPGRVYLKDKPSQDMKEMMDVIYPEILPFLDQPFAFFGHSYGSIIAYELCKRMQEEKKELPVHLFVSGRRAPHIPSPFNFISQLPDNAFIQEIQNRYGAIPAAVLNDQALLNLFLPVLKDDIRLNEIYLGSIDSPLSIPVTVYYGTEDLSGSLLSIDQWSEVTTGPFTIKTFPGGHFYIDTARQSLIQDIVQRLTD